MLLHVLAVMLKWVFFFISCINWVTFLFLFGLTAKIITDIELLALYSPRFFHTTCSFTGTKRVYHREQAVSTCDKTNDVSILRNMLTVNFVRRDFSGLSHNLPRGVGRLRDEAKEPLL